MNVPKLTIKSEAVLLMNKVMMVVFVTEFFSPGPSHVQEDLHAMEGPYRFCLLTRGGTKVVFTSRFQESAQQSFV